MQDRQPLSADQQVGMVSRTPKLGPALQAERKRQKLTLAQLAARSGVSRSMLSQIERGEANPTFAVVWSLTQALELDAATLIGAAPRRANQIDVVSAAHTPIIGSPDGTCRLRILGSPRLVGQTEWYAVEIDPGGMLDSDAHAPGTSEHFTALSDGFEVASGDSRTRLRANETARYPADVAHSIANVGDSLARGFLVVLHR